LLQGEFFRDYKAEIGEVTLKFAGKGAGGYGIWTGDDPNSAVSLIIPVKM
jgi:hypothetical protein